MAKYCSGLLQPDTSKKDKLIQIEVFMSKKRVYKQHTLAFKEEEVALVTEQGYSVAEAAESLGIRANQLYE